MEIKKKDDYGERWRILNLLAVKIRVFANFDGTVTKHHNRSFTLTP